MTMMIMVLLMIVVEIKNSINGATEESFLFLIGKYHLADSSKLIRLGENTEVICFTLHTHTHSPYFIKLASRQSKHIPLLFSLK